MPASGGFLRKVHRSFRSRTSATARAFMAELDFQKSELETIPKGVRIHFHGVIDVDTAEQFRKTLLAALNEGWRRLLLDFTDVEYVESAGFASLVELSQHLRETGGIAVLSAMQPAVQEVILSLGLDAFFGIADSEEKAMTLLKWSAPTAQPQMLDELDGDESVGFTIGPGHSSGELLSYVPPETATDEPLFRDAEPADEELEDSDDLVAEDFRMAAVGEASEVVSTDAQDGWDDADAESDFSRPGESNELNAIARAIGAPERSTDESSLQMSTMGGGPDASGSDVRITGQDMSTAEAALTESGSLPPPPPPPGAIDEAEAEPVPAEAEAEAEAVEAEAEAVAEPVADGGESAPQPMVIPASAEIGRAEPVDAVEAPSGSYGDYRPAATVSASQSGVQAGAVTAGSSAEAEAVPASQSAEEAEAVPASQSAEAVPASQSAEAVPADAAASSGDSSPAEDIPPGAPQPTTDAESEEIRLSRLRATAKLLQTIPEEQRLWRKVLVYLSHSPGEETARLNLVVASLPRNRGKDAFPVAAGNPWVTVRPRIPGAICVPEALSVDVSSGSQEVNFRIERDPETDRPDAPKPPPRLEIWYGPAIIRTVHTANPFAN